MKKPGSDRKIKRRRQSPTRAQAQQYVIESMDALGQGVAKDGRSITFIAKTLPGEEVHATRIKTKKGVSFARLDSVDRAAQNRIDPQCAHFDSCPGCHYLHCDYESELVYKKQALVRLMDRLKVAADQIHVVPASQRLGYRNRIQLHYRDQRIGLVDGMADTIVEIPNCQLIEEKLRPTLGNLYQDRSWQHGKAREGHCELYGQDDGVSIAWDSAYAHGGFTQVFTVMNQQLRQSVHGYLAGKEIHTLLDLFSGDGNLSDSLTAKQKMSRVMLDATPRPALDNYHCIDLYATTALSDFRQLYNSPFDAILLDPPRKGFPLLCEWVSCFRPSFLVYVSCNASTMVRDLLTLRQRYTFENIELMDLFPGTYHFETIAFIKFR